MEDQSEKSLRGQAVIASIWAVLFTVMVSGAIYDKIANPAIQTAVIAQR
jgi:hypothetical protein